MPAIVRAEDFDFLNGGFVLGARTVQSSSILSYHLDKRVSSECFGYGVLIVLCLGSLTIGSEILKIIAAVLVVIFAGFGIRREIQRPYVLVLITHQMGNFEIRGFSQEDAISLETLLNEELGRIQR